MCPRARAVGLSLTAVLGLGCGAGPSPSHTPDAVAVEANRRLAVRAFVRGLETVRYQVEVPAEALSRGPSEALVTIAVFVDYVHSDPALLAALDRQLDAHGQDLRVVIIPYPSKDGVLAARAVLAAERHGHGWAMHTRLVERGAPIDAGELRGLASELGITELAAFERDVEAVELVANLEQGQRLGIEWRPTLFVNGVDMAGPGVPDALDELVASELDVARQLHALGAPRAEVSPLLMATAMIERSEPKLLGPFPIPWEPEFAGPVLARELLDDGVIVETLVRGAGRAAALGTIVAFNFVGYATATGQRIMASRDEPSRTVIRERQGDPIAAALGRAFIGIPAGTKLRVGVPVSALGDGLPHAIEALDQLWLGVEIVEVEDAPELAPIAAFTGEPLRSTVRDDGLEIHDYRPGSGPVAKDNMTVEVHYVAQLADGTEFDTSHDRPNGLTLEVNRPGVVAGLAQGLEGARRGMLRKLVVPPELGYGEAERGKIPSNSTLVFFVEVMDVRKTPDDPDTDPD